MKVTWSGALPGGGRRRLVGGSARRRVMVVVAATVAVVCTGLLTGAGAGASTARAAQATGTRRISWGKAEGLRGNPSISGRSGTGQNVSVSSLSCWSVNNCAAGGSFVRSGRPSLSDFVVVERNGRWGRAEELPGTARTYASVVTVSCAAGGYCVAGGSETYKRGAQAFVAILKNGRWQAPVMVRGTAVPGHGDVVTSVSCPSARNCVAAGDSDLGAFVTRQVKGVWRQPALILHGLHGLPRAELSCWSAGNCVAARSLTATDLHGVWGTVQVIPGLPVTPQVTSVSCARDGYCAVAGYYPPPTYSSGPSGAFVATGQNGTWGTAVTWPGVTAVVTVSCPSAGNCAAVGGPGPGISPPPFVVSQKDGVWGPPEAPPGTWTNVTITSLTCWSAGNCGLGGRYVSAPGRRNEPFVASETNGRWTAPEALPGITALNKYQPNSSSVAAVSCPSARRCTAVGTYTDAKRRSLPFVTGP
jgi:hypothetical protein